MANAKMLREGAKLLNKITGEEVIVTGVNVDEVTVSVDGNEVTLNPAAMECFSYIRNDTKAPVPSAVLEDGKFIVNDNYVEVGSLKLISILGTLPGKVLVETEDSIMAYNAELDKFTLFARRGTKNTLISIGENFLLLRESAHEMPITEEKDDGTKVSTAVQVFDRASVILINSNGDTVAVEELARPLNEIVVDNDFIVISSKALLTPLDVSDEDDDEDDDEDETQVISVADDIVYATVLSIETSVDDNGNTFMSLIRNYDGEVDGKITVTKSRLPKACGSVLVIDSKSVTYTNVGYRARKFTSPSAVAAASTHPYVVGIEFGNDVNSIRLADMNYNVISLVSTKTKDRGVVISIK